MPNDLGNHKEIGLSFPSRIINLRKDAYQKGNYRRRMKKKYPAIDVMEEWLLFETLKASRGRDCTSVTTSTSGFSENEYLSWKYKH